MTHQLNSSNNPVLEQLDNDLTEIIAKLNSAWENLFQITEPEYPEIYAIRGIFNNIEPILREVLKGVKGGYVSQGYFFEKTESLTRDLERLAEAHYGNVSTNFSTKVVESK